MKPRYKYKGYSRQRGWVTAFLLPPGATRAIPVTRKGGPTMVLRSRCGIFFVDAVSPCRSPYCECTVGRCRDPNRYDARGA